MPSPLLPVAKLALEQVLLLHAETTTQLNQQLANHESIVESLRKQLNTIDTALKSQRELLQKRLDSFDAELVHFQALIDKLK